MKRLTFSTCDASLNHACMIDRALSPRSWNESWVEIVTEQNDLIDVKENWACSHIKMYGFRYPACRPAWCSKCKKLFDEIWSGRGCRTTLSLRPSLIMIVAHTRAPVAGSARISRISWSEASMSQWKGFPLLGLIRRGESMFRSKQQYCWSPFPRRWNLHSNYMELCRMSAQFSQAWP